MYKKLSFFALVVSFSAQGMDSLVHFCDMERRPISSMPQSEQEIMDKAIKHEQENVYRDQAFFNQGSKELRPKRKYVSKFHFGHITNNVFNFSAQNFIPAFPNKNDVEEGKKPLEKDALETDFNRIKKIVVKKSKIRDLSSIEKSSLPSYFIGDINY